VRLIAEAVPKRILDQMNVEGLTRENVASHLQVPPPLSPPSHKSGFQRDALRPAGNCNDYKNPE
jgi:hypothetical protein